MSAAATARRLAAAGADWRPAWDRAPRWRAEHTLRGATIGAGPKHLAQTIILAMNADGTLPATVGRRELMRRAEISAASFCRHMRVLEIAGFFTRRGVGRVVGDRAYAHVVEITLAARFAQPMTAKPPTVPDKVTDLRSYQSANPTPHKSVKHDGGSVVVLSPVVGDDVDEVEQMRERALAAQHWPRLARARSDVPMLRPAAVQFVPPAPCGDCGRISHVGVACQRDPKIAAIDASGRF